MYCRLGIKNRHYTNGYAVHFQFLRLSFNSVLDFLRQINEEFYLQISLAVASLEESSSLRRF